jgi:hypothetical protein
MLKPSRFLALLALAGLIPATTGLHAQTAQTRTRSDLPREFQGSSPGQFRGFVSTRAMFNVGVRFDNIGTVDFQEGEIASPTGVAFNFDDGYIVVDPVGSEVTSNFSFEYDNSTVNDDGYVDSFTLSRYSSEASGQFLDEEVDGGYGVEIGAQLLSGAMFNNRVRFGLIGGLGLNSIKSNFETTTQGVLYRQFALVNLEDSRLTPQDSGSYVGTNDGPVVDLNTGLVFDPNAKEQVSQELPDGTIVPVNGEVNGIFDVNGISTSLRLGANTTIRVWRGLTLEAGAGYGAMYVNSDLDIDQRLTNTILNRDITNSGTVTTTDWFHGPYAEANLIYEFNRMTRFFVGAQWTLLDSELRQEIAGVESAIILENPFYAQFGINIRW